MKFGIINTCESVKFLGNSPVLIVEVCLDIRRSDGRRQTRIRSPATILTGKKLLKLVEIRYFHVTSTFDLIDKINNLADIYAST
jgi:hypothetical protein